MNHLLKITVIPYEKYTFEEFRLNPAGFSKETYSIK
jgi:hypothetical protein